MIIEQETKTKFSFSPIDATGDPALMDRRIINILSEVSDNLGYTSMLMPSGAGHDSQTMALIAPTAMIFAPSKDGISHSPKEFTDFAMLEKTMNV